MRNILIGIQCRSNSTRLPGKCYLKIGEKSIIEHVIDECYLAARFVSKIPSYQAFCRVKLLIPRGDDRLIEHCKNKVDIIEGPEHDVLSRYVKAANTLDADYIVRITGDCFYLPSYTISRHIKYALKKNTDYTTNVLMRMQPEGYDCEVLSKKLLAYLDGYCQELDEREHVTLAIQHLKDQKKFASEFLICSAKESIDFSDRKTSIDTPEDYKRAVKDYNNRMAKIRMAMSYGKVF